MAEAASITFTISGHDRNMRRLLRDIDKGTSKVVVNLGRMGKASDTVDQKMTGWLGRAARGVTKFIAGIDLMRKAVAQLSREYEFLISKQQLSMSLNLGIEQAKGYTGLMAKARITEGFTEPAFTALTDRMGKLGVVPATEAWAGFPAAQSAIGKLTWDKFAGAAEQAAIVQKFTGVPWPMTMEGLAGTSLYTPYQGAAAAQYFFETLSVSRMKGIEHGATRIPAILAMAGSYGMGKEEERLWFYPAATAAIGMMVSDPTGARTSTGMNAMARLLTRSVPIAERMEQVPKTRPGLFPGSRETYYEEQKVQEKVPEIVFPSGRAPGWAQAGAKTLRRFGQRGGLDPKTYGRALGGMAQTPMQAVGALGLNLMGRAGAGVTARGTRPWMSTLSSLEGTRQWIGQRVSMMSDEELIWFKNRWGLGGRGVTRQAIQEFLGVGPVGDAEFLVAKERIQRAIAEIEAGPVDLGEYLGGWADEGFLGAAGEASVVQQQLAQTPRQRAQRIRGAAINTLTAAMDLIGGPSTGSAMERDFTKIWDVLDLAQQGSDEAMHVRAAQISHSWAKKLATPTYGPPIATTELGFRIQGPPTGYEVNEDAQILYDLHLRMMERGGGEPMPAPWATPGGDEGGGEGGATGRRPFRQDPRARIHQFVPPLGWNRQMRGMGRQMGQPGAPQMRAVTGQDIVAQGRARTRKRGQSFLKFALPATGFAPALAATALYERFRLPRMEAARAGFIKAMSPYEPSAEVLADEAAHEAAMDHIEMLRQRGKSEFRRSVEFAPDLGRSGEWMDQVGNALQHMNRVMQENKVNTINGQGWYEGASPLESTFA